MPSHLHGPALTWARSHNLLVQERYLSLRAIFRHLTSCLCPKQLANQDTLNIDSPLDGGGGMTRLKVTASIESTQRLRLPIGLDLHSQLATVTECNGSSAKRRGRWDRFIR